MPQIINSATLNADYGELDIDETSIVTVQLDDVWFTKKADKETWQDGQLTYTIEVRNDGDPEAEPAPPNLENITITDNIDITSIQVIPGSIQISPADAGSYTYNDETGLLQATLNSIEPQQMVTITFRVERIFP